MYHTRAVITHLKPQLTQPWNCAATQSSQPIRVCAPSLRNCFTGGTIRDMSTVTITDITMVTINTTFQQCGAVPLNRVLSRPAWYQPISCSPSVSLARRPHTVFVRPLHKDHARTRVVKHGASSQSKEGQKNNSQSDHSRQTDSGPGGDRLVYMYDKSLKFAMVTCFGILQVFIWMDLARMSSYIRYKEPLPSSKRPEERRWWEKITLSGSTMTKVATTTCAVAGAVIALCGIMYPARSIRALTLRKGGKVVNVQTHAVMGKARNFDVELSRFSAYQARHATKSQVSVKIQGKPFYYVIDSNGKYVDEELFDKVIGIQRKFK